MFKFLALIVILAVAVSGYPAGEEAVAAEAPKTLPTDGKVDLATKNLEVDLEGGDSGGESDLKGSETFGFGYYPVVYSRGWGYGGYGGGWGYGGGYGGWGGRGWGWGYPRRYYW